MEPSSSPLIEEVEVEPRLEEEEVAPSKSGSEKSTETETEGGRFQ